MSSLRRHSCKNWKHVNVHFLNKIFFHSFDLQQSVLTESLVPQSVSRARMVNSSSLDWTGPHPAPSLGEFGPSWRCAPSTFRLLSNMSACTTTSIESGWHFTTTGRGRTLSSALRCCPVADSWGWTPPYVLTKACGLLVRELRL